MNQIQHKKLYVKKCLTAQLSHTFLTVYQEEKTTLAIYEYSLYV